VNVAEVDGEKKLVFEATGGVSEPQAATDVVEAIAP